MNKKLIVLITVISLIALSGGIAYATTGLDASLLSYHSGTVEEAIDNLYDKAVKPCQNVAGNKLTIGTKYYCDLGDHVTRGMYVLKVNTDTVELIFEENLVNGINYTDAMNYFNEGNPGYELGESWTIAESISLPDATDIAVAVNYPEWNIATAAQGSYFYFGTHTTSNNATLNAQYSWLTNNSYDCNGCDISESSTLAKYYWTRNLIASRNDYAWNVGASSLTNSSIIPSILSSYGLRPTVTVAKSNLS